jgi:hypothetical protein
MVPDTLLRPLFISKFYILPWAVLFASLIFSSLFISASFSEYSRPEYRIHGFVFLLAGTSAAILLGYFCSKSGLSEVHFFADRINLYPSKFWGWFRGNVFITYKISDFDQVVLRARTYAFGKRSIEKYIVSFEFLNDPMRTIGRAFNNLAEAENFLSTVQPFARNIIKEL